MPGHESSKLVTSVSAASITLNLQRGEGRDRTRQERAQGERKEKAKKNIPEFFFGIAISPHTCAHG